jgi:cytochrome b561
MKFKLSNYNKPANRKWKQIADIALYGLTLELPIIAALPLDEKMKLWITFGITQLTVLFKLVSKFTTDETTVDPDVYS